MLNTISTDFISLAGGVQNDTYHYNNNYIKNIVWVVIENNALYY